MSSGSTSGGWPPRSPSTGTSPGPIRPLGAAKAFLLTVTAGRADLSRVDLARADPVSCLEGLRGQRSPRPEQLTAVHPPRLAAAAGGEPPDTGPTAGWAEASLLEMDPVDFEDLVAELFQQMGMQVMTTRPVR